MDVNRLTTGDPNMGKWAKKVINTPESIHINDLRFNILYVIGLCVKVINNLTVSRGLLVSLPISGSRAVAPMTRPRQHRYCL